MRALKRRSQKIKYIAPTVVTGSLGSSTAGWTGTPSEAYADVQPMDSSTVRTEYGERADNMRLVILPSSTSIDIGYGVWLAGENTSSPPWIIVAKSAWTDLANLTIEKRA